MPVLPLLILALVVWPEPSAQAAGFAAQAQTSPRADDAATQKAAKHMEIGRAYIAHGDDVAAINRFKLVITEFRTSQCAEEALARLSESFLTLASASEAQTTLGLFKQAQTAVAVLERISPDSQWTVEARDALKAFGLAPAEDAASWISQAFK
jgi:outer membrane protein assembly factor BamD